VTGPTRSFGLLQLARVQLFRNRKGTGVRKLHHKLMVIDERLVIAGSFNYTEPATTLNDENIIVLGDLESTDPDEEAADRTLAGYAMVEIERIIADLSEPV
jgi:phosphatidylserine/phosphatidylglycerophosphate/cardiolipin synthase-like enzyme